MKKTVNLTVSLSLIMLVNTAFGRSTLAYSLDNKLLAKQKVVSGTSSFKFQKVAASTNSSSLPPSIKGRVVYHSYNSYGDGSSNLYILNLGNKILSCISSLWSNVIDPMNAVWSADGKKIVFMGRDRVNRSWDLYSYTIGAKGNPVNLTNSYENREEDPKFYPGNSSKIVFKATYGKMHYLKSMDIDTKANKNCLLK